MLTRTAKLGALVALAAAGCRATGAGADFHPWRGVAALFPAVTAALLKAAAGGKVG